MQHSSHEDERRHDIEPNNAYTVERQTLDASLTTTFGVNHVQSHRVWGKYIIMNFHFDIGPKATVDTVCILFMISTAYVVLFPLH